MPIDGLSHQNVRTYYKGIKEMRGDEKRGDLAVGQWTAHTQRAVALARALASGAVTPEALRDAFGARLAEMDLRRGAAFERASGDAAACVAPLAVWLHTRNADAAEQLDWVRETMAAVDARPEALVIAVVQSEATRRLLADDAPPTGRPAVMRALVKGAERAEAALAASTVVSERLRRLANHLEDFPLDLQDMCNGTGRAASEAAAFGLTMALRGPDLVQATLLSAINVGGAASTTGAVAGALLGALNGASALPTEWLDALEASEDVRRMGSRLAEACGTAG